MADDKIIRLTQTQIVAALIRGRGAHNPTHQRFDHSTIKRFDEE